MLTPDEALAELFKDLFDAESLRRWVERGGPELQRVADELPGPTADLAQIAHVLVRRLRQHGAVDEILFLSLIRERPRKATAIQSVAQFWWIHLSKTQVESVKQAALALADAAPMARARFELVADLDALTRERARRHSAGEPTSDLDLGIDRIVRQIMDEGRVSAGSLVAGTKLIRPLGSGNFGTVWLAERIEDRREMATKVFHLEKLAEGLMLWRFRRSIVAMQRLTSDRRAPKSIVRIHEVEPDTLAYTMEYFPGGNLEAIARRGWSLPVKLEVFLGICRAVHFAHQVGIIHRDIKPANVVLDGELRPVLTDFDIADIKFVTKLSVGAGALGTPLFAAPEQLEEGDNADERSDIYSLGRLLHYLLIERSPGFQVEHDPSLTNLSGHPAALVAVVRKATQWEPARRYSDVLSLVLDVESSQSGRAALRAQVRRAGRWVRQNGALLTLAGVVSGGSMYGYVVQRNHAEDLATANEAISGAAVVLEAAQREIEKAMYRFENLERRGTDLATQLARMQVEEQGLAEQRDALASTDPRRADLDRQTIELHDVIEGLRRLQSSLADQRATALSELAAQRQRAEEARVRLKGERSGVDAEQVVAPVEPQDDPIAEAPGLKAPDLKGVWRAGAWHVTVSEQEGSRVSGTIFRGETRNGSQIVGNYDPSTAMLDVEVLGSKGRWLTGTIIGRYWVGTDTTESGDRSIEFTARREP